MTKKKAKLKKDSQSLEDIISTGDVNYVFNMIMRLENLPEAGPPIRDRLRQIKFYHEDIERLTREVASTKEVIRELALNALLRVRSDWTEQEIEETLFHHD